MPTRNAYLALHFIVLIWGFTGILGKLITINSFEIVCYRMAIALIGMLVYLIIRKQKLFPTKKQMLQYSGVGVLVALHWICFFEALKVSNVSITLSCLSSTALFVALLEPLIYKRKLIPYELLLGLMVIAGLILIFNFETDYSWGIFLSVLAAFFAALFGTINGRLVQTGKATLISTYEMFGGVILISFYSFLFSDGLFQTFPSSINWLWLLLLGLLCTAFAFVISVQVMKVLTPFTVSIAINMEPIYAIILALLFFGDAERMTIGFYAGAFVILFAIFGNAYLKRKFKPAS